MLLLPCLNPSPDRDYHVHILAKWLLRINKDMNADALNAKGRAGLVMVNVPKNRQSCSMKFTEDVHKYAAEQGIAEEKALKRGMEEKSKGFVEKGARARGFTRRRESNTILPC